MDPRQRAEGPCRSWLVARAAINSCNTGAGLTVVGQDNCFFGTPEVLDRLFAPYDDERTYAERIFRYMSRKSYPLPHSRPELQLTVSAEHANAPLGLPCSAASEARRQRASETVSSKCANCV